MNTQTQFQSYKAAEIKTSSLNVVLFDNEFDHETRYELEMVLEFLADNKDASKSKLYHERAVAEFKKANEYRPLNKREMEQFIIVQKQLESINWFKEKVNVDITINIDHTFAKKSGWI